MGGYYIFRNNKIPAAELGLPQNLWRENAMDFTASIRFRNYDVGAVKAGVLLQGYRNGDIQLEELLDRVTCTQRWLGYHGRSHPSSN